MRHWHQPEDLRWSWIQWSFGSSAAVALLFFALLLFAALRLVVAPLVFFALLLFFAPLAFFALLLFSSPLLFAALLLFFAPRAFAAAPISPLLVAALPLEASPHLCAAFPAPFLASSALIAFFGSAIAALVLAFAAPSTIPPVGEPWPCDGPSALFLGHAASLPPQAGMVHPPLSAAKSRKHRLSSHRIAEGLAAKVSLVLQHEASPQEAAPLTERPFQSHRRSLWDLATLRCVLALRPPGVANETNVSPSFCLTVFYKA